MTITDHIEALDMTLEAADGSDTITLAYATVEELRDTLAWCEDRIGQLEVHRDRLTHMVNGTHAVGEPA